MQDESTQRMPAGLLFRSFLVVGGGYSLSLILFLFSIWAISFLFFPPIHTLLLDNDKLAEVMANTPEAFFTRPFFWSLLVTNIVANFVVGCIAVWLAPFAKFAHALFVAITILISFLQQSIGQPPAVQWMFALMMAVFPIAILAGAQLSIGRTGRGKDMFEKSG